MNPKSPVKIIRNAHMLDPANDIDTTGDLLIRDGKIIEHASRIPDPESGDAEIIDAGGLYILPAFCDTHVHFRTPGQTDKEDIESGSRAALAGGFTSVIQMPNTTPTVDQPGVVQELTRDEPIELRTMGAVTLGLESRELVDFEALLKAGAVGFTDDGQPVVEPVFMRAALDFAREHQVPVGSHSEDTTIGLRGTIRSGIIADSLGVPGYNPRKESAMVERDCELADKTGSHVHIYHVSTAHSVDAIRKARDEGIHVTAEVTPHHLSLTVNDVPDLGANGKMNPPLATDEDREALIEALSDGTIDCIATDHAPHTPDEKSKGLQKAPFGVIGLESSFAVCNTELVHSRRIPFPALVEAMTSKPREIFNLEKVGLFNGSRADLVLVDPDMVWKIHPDLFESKARNCPFSGWEVKGRVLWTMYKGEIKWRLKQ